MKILWLWWKIREKAPGSGQCRGLQEIAAVRRQRATGVGIAASARTISVDLSEFRSARSGVIDSTGMTGNGAGIDSTRKRGGRESRDTGAGTANIFILQTSSGGRRWQQPKRNPTAQGTTSKREGFLLLLLLLPLVLAKAPRSPQCSPTRYTVPRNDHRCPPLLAPLFCTDPLLLHRRLISPRPRTRVPFPFDPNHLDS